MTALELGDIQGNVLAGFNTDLQVFLGLTLAHPASAADAAGWVASLAPRVTTAQEVRDQREAMKGHEVAPWLAVAVSARLVGAALPEVRPYDVAFRQGLPSRARSALGDDTDAERWVLGSPGAPVDVLLTVGANDEAAAMALADELERAARETGLERTYQETGRRLEGEREPFGFRDGLSQPLIAGDDPGGTEWPGKFIFGYPPLEGGEPLPGGIDPVGFMENGSLLVVRRLAQDVAAFHAFCEAEARRLSASWPGLTGPWLAALIVGRWPSGAPATTEASSDPGVASNAFDFTDDPDGLRCPFGAHIRKVNPRLGPRDVVEVPRLLRRGVPFHTGEERGLLFVAYQASIKDQFEFLSRAWMNDPRRPQSTAGHDLLVGRAPSQRSMDIAGPQGRVTVLHAGAPWITPTGGAYLFAPGRRALARLAPRPEMVAALRSPRFEAFTAEPAALERDGETTVHRAGARRAVRAARWPLTRLAPDAAPALGKLAAVERLDLAGADFGTETLDRQDVERLAEEPGLTDVALHGASLAAEEVVAATGRMRRLTHVDLRGVDLTDDAVDRIVEAHPALTSLSIGATTAADGPHRFHAGRLTGACWRRLGAATALRALRLRGVPLDDATLGAQHDLLARLELVDLGETGAGDGVARALAAGGAIRRLWLDGTLVGDEGAAALAGLLDLEVLDVSRTRVGAAGLRALLAQAPAARLGLAGLAGADRLADVVPGHGLRDLDLTGTDAGDEVAARLARAPRLERLRLNGTRVGPAGVTALADGPVRALELDGLELDAAALRACARLEELRLSWRHDDWSDLGRLPAAIHLTAVAPRAPTPPARLRSLRLAGALDAGLCRALGELHELERLEVAAGAAALAGAAAGHFGSLRHLVAEDADLDDAALDRLGALPRLESLVINGNPVSAAVARLRAPWLHTAELRGTRAGDDAIEALAALPRLHCLDLPGTRVTGAGVAALLLAAPNLQSLALDATQLTPACVRALGESPGVVELYLYGDGTTDETVARLLRVQHLRELNLFETSITDGVVPTIVRLDGLRTLRCSRLSREAAEALRRARPDLRLIVPGRAVRGRSA